MASPPYDLAQMAEHDAAAARRFPGPDFREVLGWIHETLQPATYVEIGVSSGCSLAAVRPPTVAVGIDPAPKLNGPWPEGVKLCPLTSSEFFAYHDLRRMLGGKGVALAFIDGLHLFEQVLADLCNLERYAAPGAVIAVHDTVPLDRVTSARRRTTEFYTGDVWKILPTLERYRPDLEFVTVATAPTGLTLIRGLDAARDHKELAAVAAEFREMEFRAEFLRLMANHRPSVEAFCQNTPVQSMVSRGVAIPSF